MEDLSITDLYAGLREPSFRDQRVTLLQLLANKFTGDDDTETTTENTVSLQEIISYCLALVATAFGNQASTQREVLAHFALSVLTNITAIETNQKMMTEIVTNESKPSSSHWTSILKEFLKYDPSNEKRVIEPISTDDSDYWIREDFLHLTSFVLCNLSQHEEIRAQMTRRSSGHIPQLLKQIKSQNVSRRHGAVGALRNCLFDTEIHWWMVDELQILFHILPPLVTPTPFTEREKIGMNTDIALLAEDTNKRPDADINIVIMLMECVVLLCQTRIIRSILRREKVYYVCRNVDYYLENDRVNDIMHDIVNFLERDEDPSEDAIENTRSASNS